MLSLRYSSHTIMATRASTDMNLELQSGRTNDVRCSIGGQQEEGLPN